MFGRKNGCRYFIDSENVNEVWVNILNILKPEDIIFLFYTDNSAHISCARAVELINIGAKRIKGIRCKEGNNGLDFQMVTQLGAVISKEPKCEYILVSNDNGFDAVVSYWKQKGYNIRREKSSYCVSLQIPDPNKPVQKPQKKPTGRQNYYNNNRNRQRIENKKDYKKPQPKLEDKKQYQPDSKKVVDLEEKKVRKSESGNRKEKARSTEGSETLIQKTVPEKKYGNRKNDPKNGAAKREKVTTEPEPAAAEPETLEMEAILQELKAVVPEPKESVPEREMVTDDQSTVTPEQETATDVQSMMKPLREEENGERHDEDFEPMETPLAIPGTATVADGSRVIDTMYCLQGLCSLIPRKNMALFHNALTCIFEQKDGDEIYAAVKTRPELHTQLWSRYEQDREERIRKYIRLLLDISDYEIQDTDLLYQVYRESYDGSLQGLNIGIMKAFGDETGVRYYRLLRKHINVLTKL